MGIFDAEWFGKALIVLISVVGTAIAGGIVMYIRERRGNWVIIRMVAQATEINISDRVRKNLEILYKGQPVSNLLFYSLEVSNEGSKNVAPFAVELSLIPEKAGEKVGILEGTIAYPGGISNFSGPEIAILEATKDYLNRRKVYSEEVIKIAFFTDVKLRFVARGGGEGWGVKLEDVGENVSLLTSIRNRVLK